MLRRTALWRATLLSLGTTSALGFARFAYGLFVPAMREELTWTMGEAGGLTTANGLGYLAGAAATAAVTRQFGPTAVFRVGMILTAAALAATGACDDYAVLMVARGLGGFAGALVFIAGASLASRLAAGAGSAAPIAIYFAGAGLGIVLAGGLVPLLLDGHPRLWALGWHAMAVAAGLATLGSWRAAGSDGTGRRRRAGGTGWQWGLAVAYLLFGAGYISYVTFLSAYLAVRHASAAFVAATWVLIGLCAVVAPAVWSRPIANWSGTRALAVLLATIATAAMLPLLHLSPYLIAASAVLFGLTFMVVPAAVTAAAAGPAGDATSSLAALTVLFATGQAAGPWLAGLLADRTTAVATLGWTATLCAIAAVVAASARPARSRAVPSRIH